MEAKTKYSEIMPCRIFVPGSNGSLMERGLYTRLGVGICPMTSEEGIFLQLGYEKSAPEYTVLGIQLDGSLVRFGGCNSIVPTDTIGRIMCRQALIIRREINVDEAK